MKKFTIINRQYIISESELKGKLGIEGSITNITLGCGRSPKEEEEGKKKNDEWIIETEGEGNER